MKRKIDLNNIINEEKLRDYLAGLGIEEAHPEMLPVILKEIESKAKEKSKIKKNKRRIKANDDAKTHVSAESVLSKEEILALPTWVRKEIKDSVVIGNSGDVIQVPDGRKYHRKNKLNDLPGGQWTFFLNSVINTRFPTTGMEAYAHDLRKMHPSPKPPQLMRDIIEFFTKENEIVLDYFMGVGGTLIGASLCNRKAIGIDLNKRYLDVYKLANKALGLNEQVTVLGDSIKLLKDGKELKSLLNSKKASLVLIDPPYGDMLAREKTGEAIKKKQNASPTPFTNLSTDLGNMEIEEFFPIFQESIKNSLQFLKPRGHIVVFMKDLQPSKSSPNLLHSRVIEDLAKINGLNYLGMKIWADQGVNLYPYGYPFAFVANQIHQYIIIFRMD
jgi:DNA modification methylase